MFLVLVCFTFDYRCCVYISLLFIGCIISCRFCVCFVFSLWSGMFGFTGWVVLWCFVAGWVWGCKVFMMVGFRWVCVLFWLI